MRMYLKTNRSQYAKLVQFKDSSVLLLSNGGAMLLFLIGCYVNVEIFMDKWGNQFRVLNRNTDQEQIFEVWAEYKGMVKKKNNVWEEDIRYFYGFLRGIDPKTDWRLCEVPGKRTQVEFTQMVDSKPLKVAWKEANKTNHEEE